jgi:hypothetical protein
VNAATIKVFLAKGAPKSLRTAELSNWTGKVVAAPRTELDDLLVRPELGGSGIYLLTGTEPETGRPMVYVGEGEVLGKRLRKHRAKDFWVHVFVFTSSDGSLTKGRIRYLEGRLIEELLRVGRAVVVNQKASGSPLPESDRSDMEVFLETMRVLLPVLGSDLLARSPRDQAALSSSAELVCKIKGLVASGARTPDGFVVYEGSQAVKELRQAAIGSGNFSERKRAALLEAGVLVEEGDSLRFAEDVEFSSPSGAASVIRGGNSNGLTLWRTAEGITLKDLESSH